MTTGAALAHLARRLPDFIPSGPPEVLTGGLLNRVWRVRGTPAPVVVKYAPDHLGALPLDPFRLTIEARALAAGFGCLSGGAVAAPRLLDFDPEASALVMEDAGSLPSLDVWLRSAPEGEAGRRGAQLGEAIGRLHGDTYADAHLATRFENRPIQKTRRDVQYGGIRSSLRAAGVPAAERIGARAEALGERLLAPGRCVVMGDLWPRSVLVAPGNLWLIDWEMAHFGQPFQDYAHLAAHLWMLGHRGVRAAWAFGDAFGRAYEQHAPPEEAAEARQAAVHAGCEIIVRALGPFREGYVYGNVPQEHALVRAAVTRALGWIEEGVPRRADLFRAG